MIQYTIYKTDTGEITESGIAHETTIPALESEGHTVFLGQRLGRDHHFVNGTPIRRQMVIVNGQLVPAIVQ
jgi:hypothetical protein